MARDATYIRDNPSATGDCDWQDIRDNWRDADATWLQERGIVRVTTTPDAETALSNTSEGRVFYSTTDKALYLSTTGMAPFKRVLASTGMVVNDGSGSVTVGIDGHEASGLLFSTSDGAVTVGDLTVMTLSIGTLTIEELVVSTAASFDCEVAIESDGSHVVVLGSSAVGLTIDQGLEVDGDISSTGLVTTTELGVSGESSLGVTTVDGTLTVADSVTTPEVTAPSGEVLTVSVPADQSMVFTAPSVEDANFFYADSGARLAWIVVDNDDPGAENFPEGTIWIQS